MKINKKCIFFLVFINSLFFIMIIFCFINYRIEHVNSKKVRNLETVYTYYDRSLSVGDFEQFDYDTTYEEMVECLGEPNGWVGSGIMRPYYELNDGRFAICHCFVKGKMESINIVNRKHFEYALLPLKLPAKTQEQKEILDFNSEDTDLTDINLAQGKFVNSITAFLRNQKEIFRGRDAWIEFWGVDETGKYMCVFITSPKKREEGVDADSEEVMYHYVTMETTDNRVDFVRVKLMNRKNDMETKSVANAE